MKNAVLYNGIYLVRNSESYKLWEENKKTELDAHLKLLKEAALKRGEIRPEPKGEA